MTDIHTNIHILRKRNHMTLEELGAKIGTTKQTIRRYETGEIKAIPYDKIVELSDALNCTPSELMGWVDEHISSDIEIERNENKELMHILKYAKADTLKKYAELPQEYKDIVNNTIDSVYKAWKLSKGE